MSLVEIEVLEGGACLSALVAVGSPLVCGALEVILLVVVQGRGKQVVHHNYPDVDTATLGGGEGGGRRGEG